MKKYTSVLTGPTPQSEPIPGKNMVENNAGGFGFTITPWQMLDRFLILGTEGGTYYVSEKKLDIANCNNLLACIKQDGVRVVNRVTELAVAGRAPKFDTLLFALAACTKLGDIPTRTAANQAVVKVCNIGTHILTYMDNLTQLGGRGSGSNRGVERWYQQMDPQKLAYQLVKYRNRSGYTHADVLRLTKPKPVDEAHDFLYGWAVGKKKVINDNTIGEPEAGVPDYQKALYGFERAQSADSEAEIIRLVHDFNLPREAIDTRWLNSVGVWEALLERMPVMALVRNLGKMSSIGLLKPLSEAEKKVCETLGNKEAIQKSKIHPIAVLLSLTTYQGGHGIKGSLSWEVSGKVCDALDSAFYHAFKNVEPSGKRFLIGVDVSGSMGMPILDSGNLTARTAAAAIAMVIARTEPWNYIFAFDDKPREIYITEKSRLSNVIESMSKWEGGGTDCAQPMLRAISKELEVDTFVTVTDNETWAGSIHPCQALTKYKKQMNRPEARNIVLATSATEFTIADPSRNDMLDIAGFDAAVPEIVTKFSKGEI